MLDGTKTQSDGKNTEGALQQEDGYKVHGRDLHIIILSKKSSQLQYRASNGQRLGQGSS